MRRGARREDSVGKPDFHRGAGFFAEGLQGKGRKRKAGGGKQQLVAGLEGQLQAQGLRQRLAKMSAGVTDGVVAEQISFLNYRRFRAGNRMQEALIRRKLCCKTGRQVLLKQRESAEKIKNQLAVFDIKALGSEQAVLLKEQEQLQSARHTFTDWERVSKELRELMLQQNQLKARKQRQVRMWPNWKHSIVWRESFSGFTKVYENARNAMTQNESLALPICLKGGLVRCAAVVNILMTTFGGFG